MLYLVSLLAVASIETKVTSADWAGDWTPSRRVRVKDTVSIIFVFRRTQEQLKQLDTVRWPSRSHKHSPPPPLGQAFWAVSNPDSADYGKHLTQDAVTKIVSPSAVAKKTVQQWLAKSLKGQNYTEDWGAHGDLLQVHHLFLTFKKNLLSAFVACEYTQLGRASWSSCGVAASNRVHSSNKRAPRYRSLGRTTLQSARRNQPSLITQLTAKLPVCIRN